VPLHRLWHDVVPPGRVLEIVVLAQVSAVHTCSSSQSEGQERNP
jgi:hypothetical protein